MAGERGYDGGAAQRLGWQHQYGGLERGTGLRFNGGNAPFVVNSVPVSRDGMVLKAGAEVAVNESATLSLELRRAAVAAPPGQQRQRRLYGASDLQRRSQDNGAGMPAPFLLTSKPPPKEVVIEPVRL